MSDFLSTLARRGAGLPLRSARPPVHSRPPTIDRGHEVSGGGFDTREVATDSNADSSSDAHLEVQPKPCSAPTPEAPTYTMEVTGQARVLGATEAPTTVTLHALPQSSTAAAEQVPVRVTVKRDDIESDLPSVRPASATQIAFQQNSRIPSTRLPGPTPSSQPEFDSPARHPSKAEPIVVQTPASPTMSSERIALNQLESPDTGSPEMPGKVPNQKAADVEVDLETAASIIPKIRPAAEPMNSAHRLRIVPSASPARETSTPIHVRIGRVDVRPTPPPPPTPAPVRAATATAPLGFAAYSRIRNYRSYAL